MFNILKNKSGVVFGMDARVTLAVTSIMVLVVGINQFANFEKNNKIKAEYEQKSIKIAIDNYYADFYEVPTINTLLNRKYLQLDDNVNSDPWGNVYTLGTVQNDEIINGQVMNVKYFYLISNGKNGVKDTASPASKADWESVSSVNDDILLKFTTLKQEEKIADIEIQQLNLVKFMVDSYVRDKEKENEIFCENVSNQLDVKCDINQDGTYDSKEELNLNYMPKEKDDSNGKYYISTPFYKSGYINTSSNAANNMYAFITLIGGSSDLVKTPRGLVLRFDSNQYDNNKMPYFGQIWYGHEVTIF